MYMDFATDKQTSSINQSIVIVQRQAAIEFTLKNMDAAREALSDMPPRLEEELDPVTLHNQVVICAFLLSVRCIPSSREKSSAFVTQYTLCYTYMCICRH